MGGKAGMTFDTNGFVIFWEPHEPMQSRPETRFRSTSPRGVFGYGTAEFLRVVDGEMMPVHVTFQGDGDGIYPVKTSAPGWWDPCDFVWRKMSAGERQAVLDEMCPEGAIQ